MLNFANNNFIYNIKLMNYISILSKYTEIKIMLSTKVLGFVLLILENMMN